MGTATALLTFEEFERLPETPEQIELLRGELLRMPPPERRHMLVSQRLFRLLADAVDKARRGGVPVGRACVEMGYLISDSPSWLRPDISITHPNQPGDKYFTGAPMLVFEVVSPSDTASRIRAKVAEYLSAGAVEVWIIYPDSRDAAVYDHTGGLRREANTIRTPAIPGLDIPFSEFIDEQ